jgi:hypothetical protein
VHANRDGKAALGGKKIYMTREAIDDGRDRGKTSAVVKNESMICAARVGIDAIDGLIETREMREGPKMRRKKVVRIS